jgi:hypothetical protein
LLGILGDQILGLVVLPNSAVYFFFGVWFTSILGTCASSSMTAHVIHAWWVITSFSARYEAAPEQDFQWTVDRTQRPSQLEYNVAYRHVAKQ